LRAAPARARKGNILGEHKGIICYTIGQRKGLGIAASAPLYVKELRKDTNEVVVSFKDETLNEGLIACSISYNGRMPAAPLKCTVKVRSAQEPKNAVIEVIENNKIKVTFDEIQNPIAIGQSAVFYDDDTVLGGGIIEEVF